MRNLSALAAALAFGFAATSAQALLLPVDDFSSPYVLVADDVGMDGIAATSGSTSGGGFTRTITHELLNPAAPASTCNDSCVRMGGAPLFPPGRLVMSNTDGYDSEVTVTWSVAAGFVPLGGPVSFFFDIVSSDGNAKEAELFINNASVGFFIIPSNTANKQETYGLSLAQQVALNAGGTLALHFNGSIGWDMTVDSVGFKIPEPTTLALAGLALLGAGVASRRRQA